MKSFRILRAAAFISALASWMAGCSGGGAGRAAAVHRMGESVPVGALVYTVMDVEWMNDLGSADPARFPKHRFAIIRLSINNAGSQELSVPMLQLETDGGNSYPELADVEGIGDWMGLLRTINPGESQQGRIVFDVPPGQYRLRIASSGDPARNETTLVEIPIRIPQPSELPAPAQPAAPQ